MSKNLQESALEEFYAEIEEILQRVTQLLTQIEGSNLPAEVIDSLYRDVHTLKGSAQLFGFSAIGTIAHALEASLEPVRQKKTELDASFVDLVFECLDMIGRILSSPELDTQRDPTLQKEMAVILPRLVDMVTGKFEGAKLLNRSSLPVDEAIAVTESKDVQIKPAPSLTVIEKKISTTESPIELVHIKTQPIRLTTMEKPQEDHNSESNTIRVQVGLLDKLMNLVGEMVLTRNQVLQYARINEDNDFLKLTQRLDLVTSELQENVMRTRMQPIGSVFSKFQRVVRDLCRDLEKNIDLTLWGAETELDKSLIEAIKDPLTHIVRNACDHGIESPSVRRSNGKNEQGMLSLKAYHEGGQMIIVINDDGGGIDPIKVKDKAIQKGVITPEKAATLTNKQAQELIFMPGFSTAEQISAVSGRGVGMDVVRTNIAKIGGIVELESEPRLYTRIRLRIPLTLAIVPAMIVSSGNELYAIPQVKLQELLRIDIEENGKIEMLQGQAIYRLRDQLLPLVFSRKVMSGIDDKDRKVFNIVVLNSSTQSYGLVVDDIKDTADIVVKPLPTFLKKVDVFSGATIMGDGSVALIVDTQGLYAKTLGTTKIESAKNESREVTESTAPIQTAVTEYLLIRIDGGTFAIPLVLVHRLEEFNRSSIDHSGDEYLVKYRDGLLPILDVGKILGMGPGNATSPICPVVVISKNNRLYGLAFDEILDITQTHQDIVGHIRQKDGLLGTVIAPSGEVLTVIDTYAVINKAGGMTVDSKKKALKKANVLLAEDTLFFVRQITRVMTEAGLEVTHAPDGEAAFKALQEVDSKHFSLIVSDIEMPRLNGFQFAEKVKSDSRYSNIPMIALTSRFKEVDQEQGIKSGFDRYLEKLQSDELIDTINSFLGVRR
jgi:two-component system chemotaxis sensor kinase CheA